MLFIDVLAINLQIRNQVSLRRSIVCINGISAQQRIDRATVGADIDERVRGRFATRRLLG